MIIKYNKNNVSQADAITDAINDPMSALDPPPK